MKACGDLIQLTDWIGAIGAIATVIAIVQQVRGRGKGESEFSQSERRVIEHVHRVAILPESVLERKRKHRVAGITLIAAAVIFWLVTALLFRQLIVVPLIYLWLALTLLGAAYLYFGRR